MLEITLAEILELVDDEAIAEQVDIPNDEARQQYALERNTVDSYQEFHEEITRYYSHHMREVIGPPEMPPYMASGSARDVIDREFRRQDGYERAYRNARTGRFGGRAGSLDAICRALKEERQEKYIEHIFNTDVDPLNYEDHVELMRQYVQRFGNFRPPQDQRRTPEDLARNYKDLIETHVQVVNNIRTSMRRFSS